MACLQETRPGQAVRIELGGNYAQPNSSVHSTWTGQMLRHVGWAGERNAGQPLYSAFDYNQNQNEIDARYREESGEALQRVTSDPFGTAVKAKDEVEQNRLTMQLLTLAYDV